MMDWKEKNYRYALVKRHIRLAKLLEYKGLSSTAKRERALVAFLWRQARHESERRFN